MKYFGQIFLVNNYRVHDFWEVRIGMYVYYVRLYALFVFVNFS